MPQLEIVALVPLMQLLEVQGAQMGHVWPPWPQVPLALVLEELPWVLMPIQQFGFTCFHPLMTTNCRVATLVQHSPYMFIIQNVHFEVCCIPDRLPLNDSPSQGFLALSFITWHLVHMSSTQLTKRSASALGRSPFVSDCMVACFGIFGVCWIPWGLNDSSTMLACLAHDVCIRS